MIFLNIIKCLKKILYKNNSKIDLTVILIFPAERMNFTVLIFPDSQAKCKAVLLKKTIIKYHLSLNDLNHLTFA